MTSEQEKQLSFLRSAIGNYIDGKRLSHTLGVEREIAALGKIYLPTEEYRLRVAALLHDITKQKTTEEQLGLCKAFGIEISPFAKMMPKTLHAKTAVGVIERDFSAFAEPMILTAVRYHTTGRAGMSMPEKLLYLADYIEDTRTFPGCVALRKYFYGRLPEADTEEKRAGLLADTLIVSFDMTIDDLLKEKAPIDPDTVAARNDLLLKNNQKGNFIYGRK